ncbi:MAG: VOC family protein [Chloroflexi bacterium]|nr:VOC family protein [Chloroflexota bacterium]
MSLSIDQQITFFGTEDLEETGRFYSEVLGLKQVLRQHDCAIWQVTETAFVGFCQRETVKLDETSRVIFTLVTDEVDAWYEHLKQQDVNFTKEPGKVEKYDIYNLFVTDPNGYLVEIQRFNQPFP